MPAVEILELAKFNAADSVSSNVARAVMSLILNPSVLQRNYLSQLI